MIATSWLYRILGGAMAVAALLWLIQSRDHWRETARANEQLYLQEEAAHAATVANYRAAAEQARLADAANIARLQAEQAAINERTRNDFESRIASARARAGELRRQGAGTAAHPGAGGAPAVPDLPASAGGTSQSTREDGFSDRDRLIATEQAIQLDELIKWVKAQAEVGTN